ncbi:Ig-like domain-containing protein [Allomuricauda sp. F6463D]|uniref:Ig-like domain-containing protein n=1 Tax=Allomuricauda sp. F6463D TaxID=2926409 RepID=UPI001FF5AF6B|nr:Ig-like domain-containing protein [Muricauda sp. F6463D]MCK0159327.1 Ig-like domain-containing protein [Muricauda sp. F6463D]
MYFIEKKQCFTDFMKKSSILVSQIEMSINPFTSCLMAPHTTILHKLVMLLLYLILVLSCSKDSDLFAEAVEEQIINEETEVNSTGFQLVDDEYTMNAVNTAFLLEVLKNDNIPENVVVDIIQTTAPQNGELTINENNVLSYTPILDENKASGEVVTDTFTYTVKITGNGQTEEKVATVVVNTQYSDTDSVKDIGELKAFPSAEGGGKYTTGGRGGSVYFVTNLNDSGVGSLRKGLSSGNRTIIFRVGGTIELNSNIYVYSSNITIAGETAPGDGIALHGAGFYLMGENYIIRHIRFRGGDRLADDNDTFRIQSQSNYGSWENYIIDHCSISWGQDENFAIETGKSGNVSVKNVTVQNSIISEGFKGYNMILWGQNINNVSVIQNYFANTPERSIECTTAPNVSFEMLNNIVYGYSTAVRGVAGGNQMDIAGNLFYDGHRTQYLETIRMENCSSSNCPPNGITDPSGTLLYHDDNVWNGNAATVHNRFNGYISNSKILNNSYKVLPSSDVENIVLYNVGARSGLSGVDSLDQNMIEDFKNGNSGGFVYNETDTTGLPFLSNSTPYTDTDNDGIEDSWEWNINGTIGSLDHNGDHDGDGYTNLEEFLHYMAKDTN